jgi:hypothetical protein
MHECTRSCRAEGGWTTARAARGKTLLLRPSPLGLPQLRIDGTCVLLGFIGILRHLAQARDDKAEQSACEEHCSADQTDGDIGMALNHGSVPPDAAGHRGDNPVCDVANRRPS